ncbi:MAG TPA: hypothetical protein VG028_07335 [Terriglobia bacterium]|nr:hypothetical protein [Terriglobia bacterium]
MKPTWLYRIACGLFILFALMHTMGLLSSKQPSPEVAAVRAAMNSVHWRFMGSDITYGGIYLGFGLLLTAALLFSAVIAWHLSWLAGTNPRAIGSLGWAFFAFAIANLALSWIFFFAGPIVASALIAACLGWAAWQAGAAK